MVSHPFEKYFSILNTDFVDDYIEKTVAKPKALNCPRLGRDLSAMYKKGWLNRSTIGLSCFEVGTGKPKWVWSYSIAPLMLNQARYLVELDTAESNDRGIETAGNIVG